MENIYKQNKSKQNKQRENLESTFFWENNLLNLWGINKKIHHNDNFISVYIYILFSPMKKVHVSTLFSVSKFIAMYNVFALNC